MLVTGKTQDAGLIINATSMAAGATVYSNWIDNVEWVRNIVFLISSDQQYDLKAQRRDTSLTSSADGALGLDAQAATTGFNRVSPISGANALLGYSSRFGLKNSSASANTFATVRVQLLGQ